MDENPLESQKIQKIPQESYGTHQKKAIRGRNSPKLYRKSSNQIRIANQSLLGSIGISWDLSGSTRIPKEAQKP